MLNRKKVNTFVKSSWYILYYTIIVSIYINLQILIFSFVIIKIRHYFHISRY